MCFFCFFFWLFFCQYLCLSMRACIFSVYLSLCLSFLFLWISICAHAFMSDCLCYRLLALQTRQFCLHLKRTIRPTRIFSPKRFFFFHITGLTFSIFLLLVWVMRWRRHQELTHSLSLSLSPDGVITINRLTQWVGSKPPYHPPPHTPEQVTINNADSLPKTSLAASQQIGLSFMQCRINNKHRCKVMTRQSQLIA